MQMEMFMKVIEIMIKQMAKELITIMMVQHMKEIDKMINNMVSVLKYDQMGQNIMDNTY